MDDQVLRARAYKACSEEDWRNILPLANKQQIFAGTALSFESLEERGRTAAHAKGYSVHIHGLDCPEFEAEDCERRMRKSDVGITREGGSEMQSL